MIKIGETFTTSLVLDKKIITDFSKFSGDINPIHLDEKEAKKFGFNKPVAHGAIIISQISKLIGNEVPGPGALWLSQDISWLNPIFIDDKITLTMKVAHFSKAHRIMTIETNAYKENKIHVMKGEAKVQISKISSNEVINIKPKKKLMVQKKESKILIVGVGGLGCPAAENLVRAGIGTIGLVDNDIINLSNIHRQSLFTSKDIKKSKVSVAAKKLREINPSTKIKTYKSRLNKNNIKNIIKDYEIIIDGSDNFKTKFLINDFCVKLKKKLVTGAISKFDGHVFTFDFNDKKTASLKSFYQENEISDNDLNCEFEGVLGTTASIVGTTQANEALKMIMKIGQTLKNQILIIDLLNLNFRKVKFNRK